MIEKYIPYIVTIVCAVVSAIVSINVSKRGTKSSYNNLVKEYGLKTGQYVSQIKFDAEYSIIKSLSACMGDMVGKTQLLFQTNSIVEYSEAGKKDNYAKAIESYNDAQLELMRSAPFISEELTNSFEALLKNANLIIQQYYLCTYHPVLTDKGAKEAAQKKIPDCQAQSQKLVTDYSELLNKLRDHVAKLDIKEAKTDAD